MVLFDYVGHKEASVLDGECFITSFKLPVVHLSADFYR